MHRLSARTLAVVSLAGLLAAASLPAHAKSPKPKQHRGKKAMGEIVSFDAATSTLVVDLPGEEDFTGTVDPDVRVKLDHRGWAKKGGSHGNPTKGSTGDLLPGAAVLKMKIEDDLVTKIRIRPSAEATPPPAEDGDDDEDATPGGDDSTDDSTDDSGGDSTDDSTTDDSDSNPDEEEDGDPEDALPPLPAPQP